MTGTFTGLGQEKRVYGPYSMDHEIIGGKNEKHSVEIYTLRNANFNFIGGLVLYPLCSITAGLWMI
ncbi:MAG: hypothetical protein D3925_15425 [Candidatus Electrothrix sp. AR5]|nr:hypothetical protein [Candidatus Electrothrix sp. AR5]